MENTVRPSCLTMQLCERFEQDPVTQAYTLIGPLDRLEFAELPAQRSLGLYFELAGVMPQHTIYLRIYGLQGLLMELKQDPPAEPQALQVSGLQFTLSFNAEGEFAFEIADEAGPLARRTLTICLKGSESGS